MKIIKFSAQLMALRKILKVSRIKPAQWKKKRHADDAGGREGGS